MFDLTLTLVFGLLVSSCMQKWIQFSYSSHTQNQRTYGTRLWRFYRWIQFGMSITIVFFCLDSLFLVCCCCAKRYAKQGATACTLVHGSVGRKWMVHPMYFMKKKILLFYLQFDSSPSDTHLHAKATSKFLLDAQFRYFFFFFFSFRDTPVRSGISCLNSHLLCTRCNLCGRPLHVS